MSGTPREDTPARAIAPTTPNGQAPARADPLLATVRVLGRLLDDLERLRIQSSNRTGAVERTGYEAMPHLTAITTALAHVEHLAELELIRAWRRHALAPWARGIPGLGEKTIARLIAEIGDPADLAGPYKLYAYCGHGDPRRSGPIPAGATQAELLKRGNPAAKKRVYLAAKAMMKLRCPACTRAERARREDPRKPAGWAPPPPDCTCAADGYVGRVVYDATRLRYQEATHERSCVRCGPAGHPALAGSPLSEGHKDARALRAVGKELLRLLWRASR